MRRQLLWSPAVLAAALGMVCSCPALGQIATDGTLGPAGALAGPNYAVTANLGRQVGTNLFHSFSTFNLTSSESATFSGPAGIANILSRVTGGTSSSIDGLLRSTIAGANLFLINPKGIMFGPNASLDLTGSFHASTANYIKLADGGRFDATTPEASVLTTAAPAAFGFLGPTPAPIMVQGSNLTVPEGSRLSLVGGPVNISDATLRTVAGDIRLVAMSGAGEVPVNATGASLAGMLLAPITIERSTITTDSGTGTAPGRIVIRGGQITVLDSSITSTNNEQVDAPPMELAASGDLTVTASAITSQTGGAGRGADTQLSGEDVTVDHNSQVGSITWGDGRGGDIQLTAGNAVQVLAAAEDPNYTNVYSWAFGGGDGGNLRLTGDTVTVQSGNVYSYTGGSGGSGSISLSGREVDVTKGAYLYTQSDWGTSGRSGDIDVAATERAFVGGFDWNGYSASVLTDTFGGGNAGSIRFAAPAITVTGAPVVSTTYAGGDAGLLRFDGDVIRILAGYGDHAVLESRAGNFTTGNGGNVEIRATREVEINGSDTPGAWTRVAATTQGSGRGGDIIVEAPSVLIDSGIIFSRTRFGSGDQGGIIIRADQLQLRNYGRILSSTDGTRNGSFILIDAQSVDASDATLITTLTYGSGNAGQVTINAQRVRMTGASSISATAPSSTGTGNAGDIVLNVGESFVMTERSPAAYFDLFAGPQVAWPGGLLSQAFGPGNAGNVFLRAPSIVLDDGRILTTALQSGRGGHVEIHADSLVMRNGAQIDAESAVGSSGDAGSINIDVSGRFEISGLSPIDGAFSGLYAQTQGSGRGGNIGIGAGTLVLDRALIRSSTGASGNAGTIRIRAGAVVLANGGSIDAGTTAGSTGAGGSVDVGATRSIVVRGIDGSPITQFLMETQGLNITPGTPGRVQGPLSSTISTNTAGAGAGGNVTLSAPRITVADGGQVSAGSSGSGTAGNIFIQAPDWLRLYNGSITTQALTSDGGNIGIRAGNMVFLNNSEISTSVGSGQGGGGNIFIDPTFVILENSRIAANAFGGAGGNINIISDYFFSTPDSVIEASSQLGLSGSVLVAAPRTDPGQSLVQLPATFLDASSLLQQSCAARAGPHASSFIGVGRGGLAAAPEGYSASRYFADTGLVFAEAGERLTAEAQLDTAPRARPAMLAAACLR